MTLREQEQLKLKTEFIKRSAVGSIFHVLVAATVWLLFSDLNDHPFWWDLLLASTAVAGLYRFLNYKSALKSKNIDLHFKIHGALLLFAAAAWGVIAANSIFAFGLFSLESMTLVFINSGLLSGAIHTLAPAPDIQKVYLTLMAGTLSLAVLHEANGKYEFTLGGMFFFYWISLWIVATVQAKELKIRIDTEERLTIEKQKIQNVVDSVPGFVFALDEKNQVDEKSSDLAYRLSESFKVNASGALEVAPGSAMAQMICSFRSSKITSTTQEIDLNINNEAAWYLISMTKNQNRRTIKIDSDKTSDKGSELCTDANVELVVVGIPIQDLKNAQSQLRAQTAKAEYSSRLATLGEMAAGIAHEVNNPLAVMMGSAGQIERMLNQAPISVDGIKQKTQKIINTGERISKIIQGLRTFSRDGEKDPFNPIPVGQLVEETLELCKERFYRFGVSLIVAESPKIEVPARAVQLSQVLLNLLNNGFDALQECDKKEIQIYYREHPNFCSILISDSGHGIPEAVVKKIFDPFFTTKEVGKGTGLGLSISKGIIEDHQGELILHSEPGKTTFEVKLPRERKATSEIKQAA